MTNLRPSLRENLRNHFWEKYKLEDLNKSEWEAICDGCGKCCIHLLQDDDTDNVWETNIACQLYDQQKRRCSSYATRQLQVPTCVQVTADNIKDLVWMPDSCSYKRLANGEKLADWHHLITGDHDSIKDAGATIGEELINEKLILNGEEENYITLLRYSPSSST